MIDPEKERRKSARMDALRTMGLFILLDRAGGRLTFTKDEYKAVTAKHGGAARIALHFEVLRNADGPDEVVLQLINKPPGNADLIA